MKPEERMKRLQLRASLLLANGTQDDEPISSVECPPPCFESGRQYREWVNLATASPLPPRADFPAEPNYCRDCSPEGQSRMMEAGRCMFPMVRFKPKKTPEGDEEVIGYTPRRFLPQTSSGSFGHEIVSMGGGFYLLRWFLMSTGSEQSRVADTAGAETFAERWGLEFSPAADP